MGILICPQSVTLGAILLLIIAIAMNPSAFLTTIAWILEPWTHHHAPPHHRGFTSAIIATNITIGHGINPGNFAFWPS